MSFIVIYCTFFPKSSLLFTFKIILGAYMVYCIERDNYTEELIFVARTAFWIVMLQSVQRQVHLNSTSQLVPAL